MRVLMLDLDTLRPDHLGCYGYFRNTSPNLDRIANMGVRFTNYHCPDAPCLPSRAALWSGRFGIHTGVVNHGGLQADMRPEGATRDFQERSNQYFLPSLFRQAGYRTVSISPFAERHSAWWFCAGMNEIVNTGGSGGESAEEITPKALDWIERNAEQDNWFLHVNYWDAHTPYRAPEDFGNPFRDEPLPDWLTDEQIARHRSEPHPHGAREIMMFSDVENPQRPRQPGSITDRESWRRVIDGYDCGIRYMDEHIGRILDALEKKGVMDDLAILVTSDHGENLGELGLYCEHATADEITCRIPMLIVWPGRTKAGLIEEGLHYNLDLPPTLAQLLDVKADPMWDGQSYLPALQGVECGREYLVLSQCAHVCQRSVRLGDWLYMRTLHDGFHLAWQDEMLFNLANDPHETRNLMEENPEIADRCAHLLFNWLLEMQKGGLPDPLFEVLREGGPYHAKGHGREYASFLERTSRAEWVPVLKEKHPEEFR